MDRAITELTHPMKPDETPAPPIVCDGRFHKHDWAESYTGNHRMCRWCRKLERTPVQPTESSSIGSKSVVEGQAGDNEAARELKARGCPCVDAGELVPGCPVHVVESPSAGEVPTPRTDALIAEVNERHVRQNVDDFTHYFEQVGALAFHARQLERETIALRQQLAAEQAKVAEAQETFAQTRAERDAAIARAEASRELAEAADEDADKLKAQLSTLRKAVEEAPHSRECIVNVAKARGLTGLSYECDCWKSRALNAEGGR